MLIIPSYNAANTAAYAPAGGGQVFADIFSQTLSSTIGPFTITIAARYKKAGFLAVPTGTVTAARVSVTGPITGCYIGNQGGTDAYDATSLTQVLFGGSGSLSQSTTSTTISDDVAFSYSGGDIILSVESNNLTYCYNAVSSSVCDAYYKLSVLEASIPDKTGYAGVLNNSYMVSRIQLDGF